MTEYSVLIRSYRDILAQAEDGTAAVNAACARLGPALPASVLVVDAQGSIAADERLEKFNPFERGEGERLDGVLADSLADMHDDLVNISMDALPVRTAAKNDIKRYFTCIFPLNVLGRRAGRLIVYRSTAFDEEQLQLCAAVSCLAALVMGAMDNEKCIDEQRKREAVRVVTESLSYSELMVAGIVLRELGGGEGIIVASRIADKEGITRSVIVNAIRKLESAGVLESRSLGMKGTYIKVLNEYFIGEISKITE